MTIIGIDSHKDLLAAARLDDAGRLVEYRPFENTIGGHRQVIDWLEATSGAGGSLVLATTGYSLSNHVRPAGAKASLDSPAT